MRRFFFANVSLIRNGGARTTWCRPVRFRMVASLLFGVVDYSVRVLCAGLWSFGCTRQGGGAERRGAGTAAASLNVVPEIQRGVLHGGDVRLRRVSRDDDTCFFSFGLKVGVLRSISLAFLFEGGGVCF